MPVFSSCEPPQDSRKYVRSPRITSIDEGEMEMLVGVFICTSAPVPVGRPRLMKMSLWTVICGPFRSTPSYVWTSLPLLLLYDTDTCVVSLLFQTELILP